MVMIKKHFDMISIIFINLSFIACTDFDKMKGTLADRRAIVTRLNEVPTMRATLRGKHQEILVINEKSFTRQEAVKFFKGNFDQAANRYYNTGIREMVFILEDGHLGTSVRLS